MSTVNDLSIAHRDVISAHVGFNQAKKVLQLRSMRRQRGQGICHSLPMLPCWSLLVMWQLYPQNHASRYATDAGPLNIEQMLTDAGNGFWLAVAALYEASGLSVPDAIQQRGY